MKQPIRIITIIWAALHLALGCWAVNRCYNLSGQQVNLHHYKGIVIVGGKKIPLW